MLQRDARCCISKHCCISLTTEDNKKQWYHFKSTVYVESNGIFSFLVLVAIVELKWCFFLNEAHCYILSQHNWSLFYLCFDVTHFVLFTVRCPWMKPYSQAGTHTTPLEKTQFFLTPRNILSQRKHVEHFLCYLKRSNCNLLFSYSWHFLPFVPFRIGGR